MGYVAALEEKVEQLEHVIEELESPRKRSVQSEDVLDKIQTLKRVWRQVEVFLFT